MENHFFVKVGKRKVRINLGEIRYIQSMRNYVLIVTRKERHMTLLSMRQLEEFLPVDAFLRIHLSYIIALNEVTAYEYETVYLDDMTLPIGNAFRNIIDGRFKILHSDVRDRVGSSVNDDLLEFSEQPN